MATACCVRNLLEQQFMEQADQAYISLLDAHLLEDVGDLASLLQELIVGEFNVGAGFIGFPDDGDLVGVLVCPSIETIV